MAMSVAAAIQVEVKADTSDFDAKMAKTDSTIESYAKKINGATSSAKDFGAATSTMGSGVSSADAALGSFGSTASNSQANVDALTQATNQQTEALKGLSLQAKGFAFMEAGEQLTSATAGLREFVATGVDGASDLNESQSAVNQVYGESAQIINDFAEGAAQNLGMTENQALSASAQLGAMFTSMGLGTEQTADFSTGILQASADLGSFHNAMPIDVMNALRAGLVGEAEPLRRFGILLNADAVEAKALEMGLADANGEISEGAKVQARYALIMSQVGAAQGDFARTSEGLANAQRINQAAMADLRAEMGQQLLPIQLEMTKVQGKLIQALADMPPHMQQIAAVGALAVGSLGPMLQTMGQLMIVAPQLGAALSAMTGPIGLIAIGLAALGIAAYTQNWFGFRDAVDSVVGSITTFASQFGQVFDLFTNGSDAASGLTQRIDGFGQAVEFMTGLPVAGFFSGLAAGLDEAGNHFASVKERVSELMGAGFTPLQAVVRALREEFPAFSGAIATAGSIVQNFLVTVQGVAAGIGDALNALRSGDWGGVFQGLLAAGQAAVTGLLNHFRILGGGILQAFGAIDWAGIGANLQAGIQTASTGLQTWFQEQSDNLAAMMSGAWAEIASAVAPAWAIVTAAISGAWANIQTTVGTAIETLKTNVGTAFSEFGTTISTAMETVKTAATTAWETVKTDTATKIEEIKTAVGTAFGGFGETISTGMAAAQTAASTIWDAIKTDATTKIEAMKTEVLGKWDTLRTETANKITDLQTTLASTFDGLKVDIPAKVGELATNAVTHFETLKADGLSKIEELSSSAQTAIQTLADEAIAQFSTLSSDATAKVEELRTSAVDSFASLQTEAVQLITDLGLEALAQFEILKSNATMKIEELSTSATTAFTALKTEAVQLVTDLGLESLAQFETLKTNAQMKAEELKTGFVTTLEAMKTEAVAKVGEIKDGIIGVFDGAIGWLEQVGKDVVQGLINGIDAMKDAAWNKMTELVSGLKNIPGAEFILGSPSKLFYQYGVWVIEGLVNGFEAMEGEAYATMQRIAERIGGRFGDAFSDGGKKAGKQLTDAVNESTDIANLTVGSPEWHQALHDKIANSMGDIGREGGKRLKKGIDEGTADATSDIMAQLNDLTLIGPKLQGVADKWQAIESAIVSGNTSTKEASFLLDNMGRQLMAVAGHDPEVQALGQSFLDLGADIRTSGGTLTKEMIGRIEEMGAKVPQVLDESGAAFGRFGRLSTDQVIKSMATMLEEITGILRNLAYMVADAFGFAAKEGTDAFADACYPGLKDAMAGAGHIIQEGAKDWESALITTGEWAGQTIGEAMAAGMTQKEASWLNQMGFVVDRAIKKGVEGGKKGTSIGEETVKQAGEGVRRKEADYQRRMVEMVTKGADAARNEAETFSDVGADMIDALGKGMTSQQQSVLKSLEPLIESVMQAFGDRVHTLYVIGQNVMKGFVMGMESQADEVEAAANALGGSVEKELRKATESRSPSEAAKRVGVDVGRGFADGISSTEDLSRKAARKLWRAAWKELKDSIKEGGFLGRDWALEFWEGMLNSPDMTGPLAAWITDQMVAAANTALKKTQALIAGIAAQLDIARGLVDAPSSIPEVPQPEPVDTSERDLLQQQLDATKDLTDAITKAFEKAFSAAHKAHIDFVQGTISESEYLAKYQAAQDAFNAKNANARQIEALEAQVKAAQAAIDAETAARQKAYEQAVKDRQAAVDAETAARKAAVAQLEQAQRDAQMQMTRDVINEANERIAQYEKEIKKASDPRERAELKAKIALERERIAVATELAGWLEKANSASGIDLSIANAQIEMLTQQLLALEEVDVGGMLQGIADAMLEAANKIAQAADKMKNAFGGGGGKNTGEKDRLGGTQDASDPSLSGGGGMGSVVQEFDKGGKAARKFGDDVNAGMGVADVAIRAVLGKTLPEFVSGMDKAGREGGKKLGDSYAVAMGDETPRMTKITTHTVESATLNGVKIGHDRGREVVTEWSAGIEGEAAKKERTVTKTFDGVVTESTKVAEKSAKTGGTQTGDQFIYWTSNAVQKGDRDVRQAAKGVMDGAGQEAKRDAHRLGRTAGDDLGRGMADGIRGRKGDVERAARELADAADRASRKQSQSRSPSRVWMEHGHDMGDGLIIGLHDRKGDAEDAARSLVYTPKGLPGGNSVNSTYSDRTGGKSGGGGPTIVINGDLNLPNVLHPEDFWPAIENLLRTQGVSAGRG